MSNYIINRASCKKFAEEVIKNKRPDISRIAPSFLDKVNKETKILIEDLILSHKEKQKTIR
jgi:hypothetical protein|tara:strand:- start:309 stop:491 length:183 start_codon:yes stop_codon:yes gene_type:complete